MKKTISLVLIAVMLLSCVAFAVPASAKATASNIDYKEALYFASAPTIDGIITEAEWGTPTFSITAYDCATIDDQEPWYEFFYNRISETGREDYLDFTYTVWFGWDLNKFYVGVKVKDPDTHSLKNGTTNTWNGDAVQMRIDKNGANAATSGGDFAVTADIQRPWSSNQVPDFLFGYSQIAGGFSEAWENTNNKGMTSFSNNPLGVTECIVAPAGHSYSADTLAGYTTYEAAIPWAYIFNGEYESLLMKEYKPGRGDGPRGAINRELGISMVVLNDGNDAFGGWDAFMAWGSGICEAHHTKGAAACSGSNSVTLVETPVAQTAGYATQDPTILKDASFDDSNVDAPGKFYDYLGGDKAKENPISYDELYTLTYDSEMDLADWGSSQNYGGTIGKIGDNNVLDYRTANADNVQTYIDTRDGTIEFHYPTSYTFEFDIMYTGVEQVVEGYASELYNWFGGASIYAFQCGYFFNDNAFKIVNSNDPNEVIASYPYELKKDNWYNWKFQYDNESCNARLWIDDLSTEADNAVSGTAGEAGYTNEWGTLVLNARWRYFYYSSERDLTEGTLLLFRQMNTQVAYDNVKIYNFASVGEKIEAPDNETPVNPGNPGNPTPTPGNPTPTPGTPTPTPGNPTPNPGNPGKEEGGSLLDPTPGNDGNDTIVKDEAGKWTIPVSVAKQYLSATSLSFTVKIAAENGTFDGISGLNEGDYAIEDLGNGEYRIVIKNMNVLKSLKAGDEFFNIIITSDVESVADLAGVLSITDAYTYPNTGDGMVFIAIAAVVSILGCAIVIGKRRASVR